MQDLTCVFEGIDNKGAIFISAIHTAKNTPLLKKHNIKAVLSIARGAYVDFVKDDIPHYLYLAADDIESYNLSQHFGSAFHFIEQARKETNILIHCMAGISRSATITAAYLMKKYQCSLQKVLQHLKRKRSKIDPNPGFVKQLKQLERQITQTKKQRQAQITEKYKQTQQQNKQTLVNQNNSSVRTNPSNAVSPAKINVQPFIIPRKNQLKEKKAEFEVKQQLCIKRKYSLSCKIDKLKRNLILKGRMAFTDQNSSGSFSPSKLYSPLIYRKKQKFEFNKF